MYLTKKFTRFVPEKVLNEKIMDKYPVPSVKSIMSPKLDVYVPEIFSASSSSYGKPYEQNLAQIQSRITTVLGPLSKLWLDLDGIRTGRSTDESLDIFDCLDEKTITLLGQAFTTTTWHRRMNILYNLTKDVKKAKFNEEILSESSDRLFGKIFYKALAKAFSVSKKAREISKQLGSTKKPKRYQSSVGRNLGQSTSGRMSRRPFQGEAPHRRVRGGGRITFKNRRPNQNTARGKRIAFVGRKCTGQIRSKKEARTRAITFSVKKRPSYHGRHGNVTHVTHYSERPGFISHGGGFPHRGKTSVLSTKLATFDTRRLCTSDCSRPTDTIHSITSSDLLCFLDTTGGEKGVDRFGNSRDAGKASYQGSYALRRSVSEPAILVQKKDGGN